MFTRTTTLREKFLEASRPNVPVEPTPADIEAIRRRCAQFEETLHRIVRLGSDPYNRARVESMLNAARYALEHQEG